MTTSFNGTTGITYSDGSTQSNSQVGMKNRIIDGGFIINQRGYASGTSLSSGSYGHDRWKAGSGGCTYTFTQGSLGVNTTITITAGTLVQVIEGCNLAEGGTYVLSWTGTAQGRLNGGTYGSSGTVTVTGWTAGTNLNVEFNTGTVGSVQLEKGSTATSFDYRPYGTELALCQRYYWQTIGANGYPAVWNGLGASIILLVKHSVTMRSAPAIAKTGTISIFSSTVADASNITYSSVSNNVDGSSISFTTTGAGASANGLIGYSYGTGTLQFSSEL